MKKFTSQQRAVIAKKLGYEGPMQGFDQFLESSPALKAKYNAVTNKYAQKMAKGGVVKKMAAGGSFVRKAILDAQQQQINLATDSAFKAPMLGKTVTPQGTPYTDDVVGGFVSSVDVNAEVAKLTKEFIKKAVQL